MGLSSAQETITLSNAIRPETYSGKNNIIILLQLMALHAIVFYPKGIIMSCLRAITLIPCSHSVLIQPGGFYHIRHTHIAPCKFCLHAWLGLTAQAAMPSWEITTTPITIKHSFLPY